MKAMLLATAALIGLSACSGDIQTYEEKGGVISDTPEKGFVAYRMERYRADGELKSYAGKYYGTCKPVPISQFVYYPTGKYYIKPEFPLLAKSNVKIDYNANGTVASITYGSEPAGSSLITAITDSATKILPFTGITAGAVPGARNASVGEPPDTTPIDPYCNAGPVFKTIHKVKPGEEEYVPSGHYLVDQVTPFPSGNSSSGSNDRGNGRGGKASE